MSYNRATGELTYVADTREYRIATEPAALTAWYQTPMGCYQSWAEAAQACARSDFDPELCITLVLVAVAGDAYEVLR